MSKILMVRNMNRVQQKKIIKENRKKRVGRVFIGLLSFFFLVALLYIGLEIVDETNRSMMSMGDSSFLSYSRLDEKNLEVVFCGDRYLVNVEKVDKLAANIKEKTQYGITSIKRFADEKGKLVVELVEGVFNSKPR
jgi:ABC-type phosphate transport system permease subunit